MSLNILNDEVNGVILKSNQSEPGKRDEGEKKGGKTTDSYGRGIRYRRVDVPFINIEC